MAEIRLGDLLSAVGNNKLATGVHPVVLNEALRLLSVHLPLEGLDPNSVTGNDVLAQLSKLDPAIATAIQSLMLDPDVLSEQNNMELTQNLADVDPKGKSIRPLIASLMTALLFIAVIGYDILLWLICFEVKRLPTLEEMSIPIIAPGIIVITYFGFLKNERSELLSLLVNRTPLGSVAVAAAQKVIDVRKTPIPSTKS